MAKNWITGPDNDSTYGVPIGVLHSHSLPRAHQFPHPWTARLQRCPVQHRAYRSIIVGPTWSKYKFTKDKGRFNKWLPQKEQWIPWSFMLFWERLEFPKPHTSWCFHEFEQKNMQDKFSHRKTKACLMLKVAFLFRAELGSWISKRLTVYTVNKTV